MNVAHGQGQKHRNDGKRHSLPKSPFLLSALLALAAPWNMPATTPYNHGNPTDSEQLMLEMVNRARANPAAEATRLGMDLNENLRRGTIKNTAKQPLAFHPRLIDAARGHSDWMLETGQFSHKGKNNTQPWHRMRAAGYRLTGRYVAGENIAIYGYDGDTLMESAQTIVESHQEGLFHSPSHRVNMMRAAYDEAGLGIIDGWVEEETDDWRYNSLATQKFARSDFTGLPFAVGVVYCDFNGNNLYDMGEGLRDVRVSVQGAKHHALTSSSGGFALPVPSRRRMRTVQFEHADFVETSVVRFGTQRNTKTDLRLPYTAPVTSGPVEIVAGLSQTYTVSAVKGATSVEVVIERRMAAGTDGAEDLSRVEHETTENYAPLSTTIREAGSSAYHLRPGPPRVPQILRYRDYFVPSPDAVLTFQGMLRATSETQLAVVEVSVDDGHTWTALQNQGQMGSAGQAYFVPQSIALGEYTGKKLLLRFRLTENSTTSVPWSVTNSGWFIDEVTLSNTEVLRTEYVLPVGVNQTIVFQPLNRGTYQLTAIPRYHERSWPAGEVLGVSAR